MSRQPKRGDTKTKSFFLSEAERLKEELGRVAERLMIAATDRAGLRAELTRLCCLVKERPAFPPEIGEICKRWLRELDAVVGKETGKRTKKKRCDDCVWWMRTEKTESGVCRDAVKRTRDVAPFAVTLDAEPVYSWGGRDCPCFEPKKG